jgi:chaperonin GroES
MRKNGKHLMVVGDRVLIRVEEGEERTNHGLYLPPTTIDILATGPGQPMPDLSDPGEEPWRTSGSENRRFVPMQAKAGDYALFFRKAAVEISFEKERYLVVPQAAILALVRDGEAVEDWE